MYLSDGKTPLVEGTIIGVNELIVSNDSKVEIRDNTGLMFRLGENSEFSLELTALGIAQFSMVRFIKGDQGDIQLLRVLESIGQVVMYNVLQQCFLKTWSLILMHFPLYLMKSKPGNMMKEAEDFQL